MSCQDVSLSGGGRRALTAEELKLRCQKRGIPLSFERGPKQGDRKPVEALRRCANQPDRAAKKHSEKQLADMPYPQLQALHKALVVKGKITARAGMRMTADHLATRILAKQ